MVDDSTFYQFVARFSQPVRDTFARRLKPSQKSVFQYHESTHQACQCSSPCKRNWWQYRTCTLDPKHVRRHDLMRADSKTCPDGEPLMYWAGAPTSVGGGGFYYYKRCNEEDEQRSDPMGQPPAYQTPVVAPMTPSSIL